MNRATKNSVYTIEFYRVPRISQNNMKDEVKIQHMIKLTLK